MPTVRVVTISAALSLVSACTGDDGAGKPSGGSPAPEGGACASDVGPAEGVVPTDRGAVRGTNTGDAWAYRGIPYAVPPVGSHRWSAPAPHDCWKGTLEASSFGPECPQLDPTDPTKVVGDEDCLTLNVWTPGDATPKSALPVLFFIHGGGNVQGSSSETDRRGAPIYDGAELAAQAHAVVVTINYRLGALGWLAHASFGEHPGNYGTLDQIAALEWTRRNARAFGGDPDHVLLFGESAGAVNVCVLLASPLAKGLFSAALMESGGCTAKSADAANSFAARFMTATGCDGTDALTCARGLTAEVVTLAFPQSANVAGAQGDFQPNVDGSVLLDVPQAVLSAGTHNHVPFVVGSNSDETALALSQAYPGGMTPAAYQAAVLAYAGGNQSLADQVLALYPASDYASPLSAYTAVTSDAKFICTARTVARAASASQGEPVYRYFFSHRLDAAAPAVRALGAWHGLELAFVFRDLGAAGYSPSAAETGLADAIDGYWSRLAATGDPNGAGATDWPRYEAATDPYLALDDTVQSANGVRTTYCDFWDQLFGR